VRHLVLILFLAAPAAAQNADALWQSLMDGNRAFVAVLLQRIREAFTTKPPTVRAAVEANARASADDLLANSTVIRDAVKSGHVGLVVAYYDLSSGKVERLR